MKSISMATAALFIFVALPFSANAERDCANCQNHSCALLLLKAAKEGVVADKFQWIKDIQEDMPKRGLKKRRLKEELHHVDEALEAYLSSDNKKENPENIELLLKTAQRAGHKLKLIKKWTEEQNGPEKKFFQDVYAASESALIKHVTIYLEKPRDKHLDWKRIHNIVLEIANFDMKKASFSAYKIRRAIMGRYSLNEFINCRD